MSSCAIVIVTCERPVSFVDATAAALLAQGADACAHRLILADGYDFEGSPPPGWEWHVRYPRAGIRVMMWWAFARAIELDVDRLIFCEDDITPCRNAIRYLRRLEIPPWCAFVSAHDQTALPTEKRPGLHAVPLRGFDNRGYCGNQCLVLPRRTLDYLVARDPLSLLVHLRSAGDERPHGADLVLGRLLEGSPWPSYGAVIPRLVRHDGASSSAAHPRKGGEGGRATIDFPGLEYDALALE